MESQTPIIQTTEAATQEVPVVEVTGTQTELSDEMLRNMGVHLFIGRRSGEVPFWQKR